MTTPARKARRANDLEALREARRQRARSRAQAEQGSASKAELASESSTPPESVNGRIVVSDEDLAAFRSLALVLSRAERVFSHVAAEALRAQAEYMAAYAVALAAIEQKLDELATRYRVPAGQSWELVAPEGCFVHRIDLEPPTVPTVVSAPAPEVDPESALPVA